MKKLFVFLAIVMAVSVLTTAVNATLLSPGLDVLAGEYEMTVSALLGETVTFDEEAFARAVGSESFDKIKISSLPNESAGVLRFGDVCVTEGQVIKKSSLSKLSFEPDEKTQNASFGFTLDDGYSMTCSILFAKKQNSAPTVFDSPSVTTFTESTFEGEMRGCDADGDNLYYEVIDYPSGGKLKYDSKTGEYTYTAGSRVMKDSFTYRVKDGMGNVSEVSIVEMNVRENSTETVFCDMDDHASMTAAVIMTDGGYMSSVTEKGKTYFSPDEEVSRLDFLISTMNVFSAANIPEVENTGFADDSLIPKEYKGYVYAASKLGIIASCGEDAAVSFRPHDTVTKAEASVILNNIIGYSAKTVSFEDKVPEWANGSVSAMYELGVYDLDSGEPSAESGVTKAAAADMLYKVYCLVGE